MEVYGIFAKPAVGGNAGFIFSDVQDSKASKSRGSWGIYQASVKAGTNVSGARPLSPEEGFRPAVGIGRTIAWIIGGKEDALAERRLQLSSCPGRPVPVPDPRPPLSGNRQNNHRGILDELSALVLSVSRPW